MKSPDWYFSADIAQFFLKLSLADNGFFTVEKDFLFWCCIINLQCRSVRFFSASSTDVLFRLKLACYHLFGQENISPSRQKDIIHRYWSKKWQSTSAWKHDRSRSINEASQDDADRTLPNRHHAKFVRGLNWKVNSRHRSWNSPDWYFSTDIEQIYIKHSHWPIMYVFTAEEVFLFWYCIKNLQCKSAWFFCTSSIDVLFRPKLACSHLFAQENIIPSRQKDIIHRYWSKKMKVNVGQETWPIECL